jgi:hypothetical protein
MSALKKMDFRVFSASVTNNSISDTIKNNTYELLLPIFRQLKKVGDSTKRWKTADESCALLNQHQKSGSIIAD